MFLTPNSRPAKVKTNHCKLKSANRNFNIVSKVSTITPLLSASPPPSTTTTTTNTTTTTTTTTSTTTAPTTTTITDY